MITILPCALVFVRNWKSANRRFEAIDREDDLLYATATTSGDADHNLNVSIDGSHLTCWAASEPFLDAIDKSPRSFRRGKFIDWLLNGWANIALWWNSLLDLCSMIICHRFYSTGWWAHLGKHISTELTEDTFDKVVTLKVSREESTPESC